MRKCLLAPCIIIFCLNSQISFATYSLLDISETVELNKEGGIETREDATQAVIQKISEKYIIELIGEDKYQKNKRLIADKIIKEYGKYIPFIKSTVSEKDKNQVVVSLRFSTSNLMDLLNQNGMMHSEFASAIVYPMIQIIDRVNIKNYKWWVDKSQDEFLLKTQTQILQELQKNLRDGNLFVLNPIKWNLNSSIPIDYRKDFYRRQDIISLGEYFRVPVIIQGTLEIALSSRSSQNFNIKCKLSAYLSNQGKVIAEVLRSAETEAGDFSAVVPRTLTTLIQDSALDIGQQIQESWKKGSLNQNSILLTVYGSLSYQTQELLKKSILQSVSKLRSMTETYVESSRRIFLLDYSGTPEELSDKLKSVRPSGLKVEVRDVSLNQVAIRVSE